MATKGYNSYHGRMPTGKKILIVVLVILLLGACAFLYCQNHLVYDDSGKVHLELPFGKKEKPDTDTDGGGTEENNVPLEREEPQRPTIDVVHGQELSSDVLTREPAGVLQEAAEADTLVINVKLADGSFTYQPGFPVSSRADSGDALDTEHLKALLASGKHMVARVSALCDTAYAYDHVDEAGLKRTTDGWLWYDYNSQCWLDPASAVTAGYLKQVCRELAEMGFDEILLDWFGYPTYGRTDLLDVAADVNREKVLADLVSAVREAVPKITAVSVVLREDNPEVSGLTPTLLAGFDRIYADSYTVDCDALVQKLPDSFKSETQLVKMVREAQSSGSYMIVQ